MLKLAIQHLGRRVAIPTLETHIESFYSYCKQPCSGTWIALQFFWFAGWGGHPATDSTQRLFQGTSIRRQAWVARRCMSEFNTIARRPHVPREVEIQGLLKDLGINLPKKNPQAFAGSDDEASFGEEDTESESEQEEDELVEPGRLPFF